MVVQCRLRRSSYVRCRDGASCVLFKSSHEYGANSQTCEEEIPRGSVTSYGHIARLLGRRKLNHFVVTLITICCAMRLTLFLNQAQCPRSAISNACRRIKCLLSCRQVGVCLKHLPSSSANTQHHFHDANVPWQRVINAKGVISPRSAVKNQGS